MQFTAEHDLFRKTVRDVVEREINPYVDEWEDAGIFPAHELFPKLAAAGLLGLEYDPAYGGQGADHSYTVIYGEEVGPGRLRRRAHGHQRADRHGHAVAAPLRQPTS